MNVREYVDPPPFFGARRFHCHVRPRYSGGSGAMVADHIALQVVRDERVSYEHALSGAYGDAQRKRAEALGLRDIAVALAEKGSGRNFRWLVYDLVTRECFVRHHTGEIEGLGFRPFRELPEQARRVVNLTGRDDDYERTYWKFENLEWVQYQPEPVREP